MIRRSWGFDGSLRQWWSIIARAVVPKCNLAHGISSADRWSVVSPRGSTRVRKRRLSQQGSSGAQRLRLEPAAFRAADAAGGGNPLAVSENKNGAVASAVLVHQRVDRAHFDWRWRERPARALLAWEALARSVDETTSYPRGDKVNFGPAAITDRGMDGHIGNVAWGRDERAGRPEDDGRK